MGGSTDRKRKINLDGDVDDNNTARNGGKHHQDTLHARQSSEVNPWTGRTYSQRYKSILQTRLQLPVYQFQSQLLEAVSSNQTVVVEGETGSGKTTQIPQFLVEVRTEWTMYDDPPLARCDRPIPSPSTFLSKTFA